MLVIETKRLRLEPLGIRHLETAHVYASDLENTKYMLHLPNETVEETRDFLQKAEAEWQSATPSFYEFAILYNSLQIGSVGIERVGPFSWEFGWILHKNYWGQGFACEAAGALMDYAVKEWKIRHFIAHCDSENIASCKTMEKLGMSRTGTYGGRKNRASDEERTEYQYELERGI